MNDNFNVSAEQATPKTAEQEVVLNLQLFAEENESIEESTSEENTDADTNTSTGEENSTEVDSESVEGNEDKPAVPDEYADFTAPEGLVYDAESSQEFKTIAKELGLTQDGAQKMADLYGKNMASQQAQQQEQSKQWFEESKKAFKPAEIDLAKKTLGRFADKEFMELLENTGLGNHKQMIGVFKSIGQQISEGKFADGGTKPSSGQMFPNSPDMYK